MTDHDKKIEELVNTVPTIKRTPAQKALRVISLVCNVFALVALVGVVLATNATSRLEACTNDNLANRNPVQLRDSHAQQAYARATKAWVSALDDALAATLTLPMGSPGRDTAVRQFSAESMALKTAANTYVHVLTVDAAYRAAHPLGRC